MFNRLGQTARNNIIHSDLLDRKMRPIGSSRWRIRRDGPWSSLPHSNTTRTHALSPSGYHTVLRLRRPFLCRTFRLTALRRRLSFLNVPANSTSFYIYSSSSIALGPSSSHSHWALENGSFIIIICIKFNTPLWAKLNISQSAASIRELLTHERGGGKSWWYSTKLCQ